MIIKYTFSNNKGESSNGSFLKPLKKKVDNYFAPYKFHHSGNRKPYSKGALQVLSAISLSTVLAFLIPIVAVALSVVSGLNLATILHRLGNI